MDTRAEKIQYFNDTPICAPEDDMFAIDPFAQAIANSIKGIKSPVGSTICIDGTWGSGKSSAVNLIRYHLKSEVESENIKIIDFKCWWFSGEEALTLAFLQELNASLSKNLRDSAKELIPKLGKVLLSAGPVIGQAINIGTSTGLGNLFSNTLDFAKYYFHDDESIDAMFDELSNALEDQEKRFLIIIDDIDRLAPDESLLIFKLIKSVGRLPNIVYLLAFDRELAEKLVKEKYPSEGPHFLEKIIQANFNLPQPPRDDLDNAFLSNIDKLCGIPTGRDQLKRFMNIFYDVISAYLTTPRDLVRVMNSITVTWPAVENEVNLVDFLAMEMLRINEPLLHKSIRDNKYKITGNKSADGTSEKSSETIERIVGGLVVERKEQFEVVLKRLFPRLENVGYSSDHLSIWEADRLVCTEKHFDTYFRLAIGDETLPFHEINRIIEKSNDIAFIKQVFLSALKSIRKNGKSKVPLLLQELNIYASKISESNFQNLITAIFEIADEIDRDEDSDKGFGIATNHYRIHWLIRKLTLKRCTNEDRSAIFYNALEKSQIGWLVNFSSSAIGQHQQAEDKPEVPPEQCLMVKSDIDKVRELVIRRIEELALNGGLIDHKHLTRILYFWHDNSVADHEKAKAKAWTTGQINDDINASKIARALTSESWSQGLGMNGLGDRISIRNIVVNTNGAEEIIDVPALNKRLEEIQMSGALATPYNAYIDDYLSALSNKDEYDD